MSIEDQVKKVFCLKKEQKQLTHEECLSFRKSLPAIQNESVPTVLAQVLLDLVKTHTAKAGNSENAEAVIQYLDVYSLLNDDDIDAMELNGNRIQAFEMIDCEQALVIHKWLTLAETWKDLAWYQDEIKSAANYWLKRANKYL